MLLSTPEILTPEDLFGAYRVTPEDRLRYARMIASGERDEATEDFILTYIAPYAEAYADQLLAYLRSAAEGEIRQDRRDRLTASVTDLTLAAAVLLGANFESFTRFSLAPQIFEAQGIASPAIRDAILEKTLANFKSRIQGALSQTEARTLESIRSLQTEMVIQNQRLGRLNLTGARMAEEIANFKEQLRNRYPDIYADMEAGKVIKNRAGASLKLDAYVDNAARTTVLEVERVAVEVSSRVDGAEVVEYFLADPRSVKEEREICQDVLKTRVLGKSILALNQETADALGIMTVEEARGEGAMGPYCRHSIRPVSNTYADKIAKLLRGQESAA